MSKFEKFPEVKLATIGGADSAITLACTGELSLSECDQDYLEFADAAGDLDDIAQGVPYIKADAGLGRFTDPSQKTKNEKLEQAPKELTGIILARKVTPHLRGVKDSLNKSYPGQCARSGFVKLMDTEGWICRSSDKKESSRAILNNRLTPEQKSEALRLQIGGATGKGCDFCPFARGNWEAEKEEDRHGSLCQASESIIWLDSRIEEPKVLSVGSYKSLKALKEFYKKLKRPGVTLPTFTYVVRLSWESVIEKGNEYYVLVPTILGAVEKSMLKGLDQVRRAQAWMLERVSNAVSEGIVEQHDHEGLEDLQFVSAEENRAAEKAIGGLF